MCNVQWIFWNLVLVAGRVGNILVVHPFYFEVKVHVLATLAQPLFLVFCNNDPSLKCIHVNRPISKYIHKTYAY